MRVASKDHSYMPVAWSTVVIQVVYLLNMTMTITCPSSRAFSRRVLAYNKYFLTVVEKKTTIRSFKVHALTFAVLTLVTIGKL